MSVASDPNFWVAHIVTYKEGSSRNKDECTSASALSDSSKPIILFLLFLKLKSEGKISSTIF